MGQRRFQNSNAIAYISLAELNAAMHEQKHTREIIIECKISTKNTYICKMWFRFRQHTILAPFQ